MPDDTIAALATAAGRAAVAVVRVSGPQALQIGQRLLPRAPRPRHAELASLRSSEGELIDRALVLYFPAPHSYTGEDVIEFHVHGGAAVSDWLLECLHGLGARPAQAGEFTLRAFLNDKLDLTQAEAVADLIESRSRLAAQAALRSLRGRFSAAVRSLQEQLTELRVLVEAWLDFPDEDLDVAAQSDLVERLKTARGELALLRTAASEGAALADGLSIAIAGPPNAGKSSLLNALAGYDAAIVTDIPGTTRDPLHEQLVLDGLPINIVDTAGLRVSDDPIEREGVRRAQDAVGKADHVLWVADIRDGEAVALDAARQTLADSVPFTLLLNKVDLLERGAAEHESHEIIELSALHGTGINLLITRLKVLAGLSGESTGTFSARRRQLQALDRVAAALDAAEAAFVGGLELAAEELRGAQAALGELTGEFSSDDLLGEIFSRFCIGK